MNCPAEWVREIGQYVKSLAPDKLFVDGTYGVNTTHMAVTEVDIFSNHYYGPNIDKLKRDLDVVVKANRTYFAGEYDWITSGPPDLADWFKAIETSEGAIGDAFWSQFGRDVPDCNVSWPSAKAQPDRDTDFGKIRPSSIIMTVSPCIMETLGTVLRRMARCRTSISPRPHGQLLTSCCSRKIVNHFMTMSQGKSLPASAPLPSVACPST